MVLLADLVDLAAFDRRVLVVHIVELNLHNLDLRMLRKDPVEHLRLVVEADAEVADLSLRFQLEARLVRLAAHKLRVIVLVLRVHQIEVEVVHAAPCELLLEERADVLLLLKIRIGQLVGQNERFARMTLDHACADRGLRLAAEVPVRRVEIVEPRVQKRVGHFAELRRVHLAVTHRQPHTAEPEIAVNLRKEFVDCHALCPPQKNSDSFIISNPVQKHKNRAPFSVRKPRSGAKLLDKRGECGIIGE